MTEESNTQSNVKFEDAYSRLDEISRRLEDSNTPLEQSFELFEEGQKLLQVCHNILDKAEKKIKLLTEKNGELQIEEKNLEQ